ncbi:hypothetical protein LU293_00935 [Moraxella nasovis]|uniref:hypothetical protein n=1 Tax=Moraxella nasovis TaxID=2904121 RepID=UPI001F6024C8|nr:hypothetical protein [Moraxella nasovis]UNU73512.1 hypothetical protein LU293_00935 [Moraxella nasovis]
MKKLAIALLSISLFTSSAVAKTPSDSSLIKLAQLQDLDKQIEVGVYAALHSQRMAFEELVEQNNTITADQKRRIGDVFEKYTRQTASSFLNDTEFKKQNLDAFIAAAKASYTQAEVDAYNQFLSTKEGQSITKKLEKVSSEYLANLNHIFGALIAPSNNPENAKLQAKMQQEIFAILAE